MRVRNRDASRAYDALAPTYDREVAGDEWMRRILWSHYDGVFRSGDSVLDLGCGTGTDAVHLAQRGICVTAIDASPAMIEEARRKVERHGLRDRVQTSVLDVEGIGTIRPDAFDGIISSFAGLNALPSLERLAADAAALLHPEGRMIVHLLNRWSLWEWLGLLRRREWTKARTLAARPERTFTIGGTDVPHRMIRGDEVYREVFSRHFRLRCMYALGILRPPHTVHRVPSPIVRALGGMDDALGARHPFVHMGRFVVLDMARR